jgi:hypothetical protein
MVWLRALMLMRARATGELPQPPMPAASRAIEPPCALREFNLAALEKTCKMEYDRVRQTRSFYCMKGE